MSRNLDNCASILSKNRLAAVIFEFDGFTADAPILVSHGLQELLQKMPRQIGAADATPSLYLCFLSAPQDKNPKIVVLVEDKDQPGVFSAFGIGSEMKKDDLQNINHYFVRNGSKNRCRAYAALLREGCFYDENRFLYALIRQCCTRGRSVTLEWFEAFFDGVAAASVLEELRQARHDLEQLRQQLHDTLSQAQELQDENEQLSERIDKLQKAHRLLQVDLTKSRRQSVLAVDAAHLQADKDRQADHTQAVEYLQDQVIALTQLLEGRDAEGDKLNQMRQQLVSLTQSMRDMTEQNTLLAADVARREGELEKLKAAYAKSDGVVGKSLALQDELDILRARLEGVIRSGNQSVSPAVPALSLADELHQEARHEFQHQLEQAAEAFELTKVMQLCQDLSVKHTGLHALFLQQKINQQKELKRAADAATVQAHMGRRFLERLVNKSVAVDHSDRDKCHQELEAKDAEFRDDMLKLTDALHTCLSEFNIFIARITAENRSGERDSYIENKTRVIDKLHALLLLQVRSIENVLQTIMPQSAEKKLVLRRELLKSMIQQSLGNAKALVESGVDVAETTLGGLPKFIFRLLSLSESSALDMQENASTIYTLCNQLLVHLIDRQQLEFKGACIGELCRDFIGILQDVVASALHVSGRKYQDWQEERSTLCGDAIQRMENWLKKESALRKLFFRGKAITNTTNVAAQAYAAVSRPGREVNSRETDTIDLPSQVGGLFTAVLMWINHLSVLEQAPSDPSKYKELNNLIHDFVKGYMDRLAIIHHDHYVDIEPGELKEMNKQEVEAHLEKLRADKERRDAGRADAIKLYHRLFVDSINGIQPLIADILEGAAPASAFERLREFLISGIRERECFVEQAKALRQQEIADVMALPQMAHVVPGVVKVQSLFRHQLETQKGWVPNDDGPYRTVSPPHSPA